MDNTGPIIAPVRLGSLLSAWTEELDDNFEQYYQRQSFCIVCHIEDDWFAVFDSSEGRKYRKSGGHAKYRMKNVFTSVATRGLDRDWFYVLESY